MARRFSAAMRPAWRAVPMAGWLMAACLAAHAASPAPARLVLYWSAWGDPVEVGVAVNGRTVGRLARGSYLPLELMPGRYLVRVGRAQDQLLSLAAGQSDYEEFDADSHALAANGLLATRPAREAVPRLPTLRNQAGEQAVLNPYGVYPLSDDEVAAAAATANVPELALPEPAAAAPRPPAAPAHPQAAAAAAKPGVPAIPAPPPAAHASAPVPVAHAPASPASVPVPAKPAATAATGVAPPPVAPAGLARWAYYQGLSAPKAFVVFESGTWRFWHGRADAAQQAADFCAQATQPRCWLYAIGDQVVWQADPAKRIARRDQLPR